MFIRADAVRTRHHKQGEDTIYIFSFIPKRGCGTNYIEIKSKEGRGVEDGFK